MDRNKLIPWNWFKKEQEQQVKPLAVRRAETPTTPLNPIMQLHQELDNMFDDFFQGFGLPSWPFGLGRGSLAPATWLRPTMDIAATDQEYTITVELPGVDEKDVQLELENSTLRIRGEKTQEQEEKNKDYYSVERAYGAFQRMLSLPEDADQNKIEATYKNGVMKITIPRKEAQTSEAKRITIKSQ